jgi:hypothetical protein
MAAGSEARFMLGFAGIAFVSRLTGVPRRRIVYPQRPVEQRYGLSDARLFARDLNLFFR